MSSLAAQSLGFLSVFEEESLGFFGGLLLVDRWVRPLEFHCSTPVKPTRAQEILYGATLGDYLLGELIGGALVAKCKTPPRVLFVDRREALVAGAAANVPTAWLDLGEHDRMSLDHLDSNAAAIVREAAEGLDLAEPFDRIRQALGEVHRQADDRAEAA